MGALSREYGTSIGRGDSKLIQNTVHYRMDHFLGLQAGPPCHSPLLLLQLALWS